MTLRASICVDSDSPEEQAAFESWLEHWRDKVAFVSGDYGCGCCVHLYDVEGPKESIEAIPDNLRCESKWVSDGVKSGDPSRDIVPQQ